MSSLVKKVAIRFITEDHPSSFVKPTVTDQSVNLGFRARIWNKHWRISRSIYILSFWKPSHRVFRFRCEGRVGTLLIAYMVSISMPSQLVSQRSSKIFSLLLSLAFELHLTASRYLISIRRKTKWLQGFAKLPLSCKPLTLTRSV